MTQRRYVVRATAAFFDDLDDQLGADRGPRGEPSAIDFQVHELFEVIEHFATKFEQLPSLFADRYDYRVFIAGGSLVPAFSVIGQLVSDDAIELLSIDLDLRWES